ncbi:MAG TPA: hypothetical protein VMT67_05705 [Terriglobales bacterium]|nr:hypothetical protein [Terriglobales bacterium]
MAMTQAAFNGVTTFFRISLPRRRTVMHKSFLLLAALLVAPAFAQQKDAANDKTKEVIYDQYRVHQSIEFGYRAGDITGSKAMFDTLVNEHEGPRLLEQMFSMQSVTRQGTLFDDLNVNSVGWGGDPNNYLRARVSKDRLYDFRASFRRDQNLFDYDLLANPLNYPTSSPNVPINDSPHEFQTRRRMSDFDLTLLPRSLFSFRLGFTHNNMTGDSWTSVHEGTEALLLQPWNTTTNTWRLGVDFKPVARTVISYDQIRNYFKGDTFQQLNSTPYQVSTGVPTDLGLVFNTAASQPCAMPLTGGFVTPTCSAYFAYDRFHRTRTALPTQQLSLRSNYLKHLDLTGSMSYTSGDLKMPAYVELFDGLGRNRLRDSVTGNSVVVSRVAAVADFAAVIHVTDRFRIIEKFRFNNFRLPGSLDGLNTNLFAANLITTPNVFDPASCPPPYTAATCPQHVAGSAADATVQAHASFFKQDSKTNTVQLQYDVTRKLEARLGYRYERRHIDSTFTDLLAETFDPTNALRGACVGGTVDSEGVCTATVADDGSDTFEIQQHSLLAGLSFRPSSKLRANFDAEQSYADYSLTRISPRKQSRYRANGTFTPRPWAVLGVSMNLLGNSNEDALVNYRGHANDFGFNADLNPHRRIGADFAYNYLDFQQNTIICFNDTPPTGVTLPVVTNAGSCAANDANNPLLTNGFYTSKTHYGLTALTVRPVPRVTARAGYSITSVGGSTPQFNVLQPQGALVSTYQLPIAGVDVDIAHDLAWRLGWNYYQYGENDFVGPTAPRYFHANNVTVSLRYAF